ncbi:hypothetical protein [Lacinutrix jangbogonensis]|nr:hypothetical protein [Lacinutrix jangbogonensis]
MVFFKNEVAFDIFTNEKLKFGVQASGVGIKKGISADLSYS